MKKSKNLKINSVDKIRRFIKDHGVAFLVGVIWEDAMTYTSVPLEAVNAAKQELVTTYGVIAHYDDDYIVVMTHDSGGEFNDYVKVPMALVRNFITN